MIMSTITAVNNKGRCKSQVDVKSNNDENDDYRQLTCKAITIFILVGDNSHVRQ